VYQFDGLTIDEAKRAVNYGVNAVRNSKGAFECYCDFDPKDGPDRCEIDKGTPEFCVYAGNLVKKGSDQWSCVYWRAIPDGEKEDV